MDDVAVLCRGTTEWITEAREGALPWWRRGLLRFHLAICPYCKAYVRQLDATVHALGTLKPPDAPPPGGMDALLEAVRARRRPRE